MPAKIRKIKATQISSLETSEFNKSLTSKGGTFGRIDFVRADNESTKIKAFKI
jgi:hypothetical protein